jgi:hypothetical protein
MRTSGWPCGRCDAAIVSQLVGDAFSVVAVDDPADGSVAIDQDGHQDAVDDDVVP